MSFGKRTDQRPLVFEGRDDLPPGHVLFAFDGHLSVTDASGTERASLSFRRERWVLSAVSPEGDVVDGIAPSPADAWRMILDVIE